MCGWARSQLRQPVKCSPSKLGVKRPFTTASARADHHGLAEWLRGANEAVGIPEDENAIDRA